ncbi:hypothetical protein ES707_14831 [subsurface metagenome]
MICSLLNKTTKSVNKVKKKIENSKESCSSCRNRSEYGPFKSLTMLLPLVSAHWICASLIWSPTFAWADSIQNMVSQIIGSSKILNTCQVFVITRSYPFSTNNFKSAAFVKLRRLVPSSPKQINTSNTSIPIPFDGKQHFSIIC